MKNILKTDSKIILKILEILNCTFIDLDRDKNIKEIIKNELLLRIKNFNLFKNIFYKNFFTILFVNCYFINKINFN